MNNKIKSSFSSMIGISLSIIFIFLLSGCVTKTHTIYIHPEYIKLPKITTVEKINSTYVQNGCLFINDKNTSLCGNELGIIITHIKKLRINEQTCTKMINDYNKWVEKQDINNTETNSYKIGW